MTVDDLQQQLKEICIHTTHEASDPRLTRAEVFDYLTVVNSAAQISIGLLGRIERIGLEGAKDDIFRFVGVAVNKILEIRRAAEERESGRDPLEDAWDDESDAS